MGRQAYLSYILLVEAGHLLILTSLSISVDRFWAVAIFITSLRCPCARQLRTFDLLIFITYAHISMLSRTYKYFTCKGCDNWVLWWQGLVEWFDCNRCVLILQQHATLQFYQFHLHHLWDLGSVRRESTIAVSILVSVQRCSSWGGQQQQTNWRIPRKN